MRTSTFKRLAAADRLDFAFLQGAQQLHLRRQRQFADLVEEQRAAVGLDELAGVLLGGAGEGTLLVAEQDRLDQVLGNGAAIDGDKGLGLARARAVDGAREQFLAGAGFAFDQHGDGGTRRFLRRAQHRLHGARTGDDVGDGKRAVMPALDALQFAGERTRGQRIAQRDLQPLGAGRLDHEIGGARAHGRDYIVDAAMRSLYDHRDVEACLAHARQHAEPVEIGHHQVEHHAVDTRSVRAGEQAQRGIAALGGERPVAKALHHRFQKPALDGIVVDDEHAFGHDRPPDRRVCRFGAISRAWLNGVLNGLGKAWPLPAATVGRSC